MKAPGPDYECRRQAASGVKHGACPVQNPTFMENSLEESHSLTSSSKGVPYF